MFEQTQYVTFCLVTLRVRGNQTFPCNPLKTRIQNDVTVLFNSQYFIAIFSFGNVIPKSEKALKGNILLSKILIRFYYIIIS